jgi:hypothetical protein
LSRPRQRLPAALFCFREIISGARTEVVEEFKLPLDAIGPRSYAFEI